MPSNCKMNSASNVSGTTTYTTTTSIDNDNCSSTLSNIDDNISGSTTPPSVHSATTESTQHNSGLEEEENDDNNSARSLTTTTTHLIYDYKAGKYIEYTNVGGGIATCEDVCIEFSKRLEILPTYRLLFGLFSESRGWAFPGARLQDGVKYFFRLRFKIPEIETKLKVCDKNAYEYLYRQERYDMLHEKIPEIRYPNNRDYVVGMAVVDMCIDELEGVERDSIIANCKRYVPRKLIRVHGWFAKRKICNSYRKLRTEKLEVNTLKMNYICGIHVLAPTYLSEIFTAEVNYMPNDDVLNEESLVESAQSENEASGISNGYARHNDSSSSRSTLNRSRNGAAQQPTSIHVHVKLDLYDTEEPGLKIARKTSEKNKRWILLEKLENIFMIYIKDKNTASLEINGFPKGYLMKFEKESELNSFITYLAGYIRLTSKWMLDLCLQYETPSIKEMNELRYHGPIRGQFSFAKIDERKSVGSYIIRQCEEKYDVYYIDIRVSVHTKKTFMITRQPSLSQWKLHLPEGDLVFHQLHDVAIHIPVVPPTQKENSSFREAIPPLKDDKPPELLICLPKNVKMQMIETSKGQLQGARAVIFNPQLDLRTHQNTFNECDDGLMYMGFGDWIQADRKDIKVTLKILQKRHDEQTAKEFITLANIWSLHKSPQILKLFGIALQEPYGMIMECATYGDLKSFLSSKHGRKVGEQNLSDIVLGLVRAIKYLEDMNIYHNYIRCCNLFVTNFTKSGGIVTKLGDPGLRKSYKQSDLPWIPLNYHNSLSKAINKRPVEHWAFGTTVYEIYSRGVIPTKCDSKSLFSQYKQCGFIFPMPNDNFPNEINEIIMDAWSQNEEERFQLRKIFRCYIEMKENTSCESNNSNFSNHSESMNESNGNSFQMNGMSNGSAPHCSESQTSLNRCGGEIRKKGGGNIFVWHNTKSAIETVNGVVKIENSIGEGHYGCVYAGVYEYNEPNKRDQRVAIKMMKTDSSNPESNKDFLREIEIMIKLKHPNIVKILDYTEEPFYIIMEYIEGGSFLTYLSSNPNLTNKRLLQYAMDIAKGMEYLSQEQIIHRDLAARNILVDGEHVKISDFGLAQKANSNGYYKSESARDVPYRWYAPDALKLSKYSSQTDVWSYGVTLFEMFSRGQSPNLDPEQQSMFDLLTRLERGERLKKPSECPQTIYNLLMLECWHAIPEQRPSFTNIIEIIQSIMNEVGDSV